MQRRPIDVVFSIGFFAAAALLIVVGFVMSDNASFLDRNVDGQIRDLNIAFPARDQLTQDELAVPCVMKNASKVVSSSAMASCYANEFLGPRIATLVKNGPATDAERDALARGNALRSALQTDVTLVGIGSHTRQIADVAYISAAVFALAGLAGLAHWSESEQEQASATKPKTKLRRHPAAA